MIPACGPPSRLITAEADHVDALVERFPHRVSAVQAVLTVRCQIDQGAASLVVHDRYVPIAAQRRQFVERHRDVHAGEVEVAPVDGHDEGRPICDGRTVVVRFSVIGRSHPYESGSARGHDVRHAEGPSDFHQLSPGDDDFSVPRQGVQDQHDRGGVVVHHDGRFRSGQGAQQPGNQVVARTSLSRLGIDLQRAVSLDRVGHGPPRRIGQHGPSQTGVEDHARAVYGGCQRAGRKACCGCINLGWHMMIRLGWSAQLWSMPPMEAGLRVSTFLATIGRRSLATSAP